MRILGSELLKEDAPAVGVRVVVAVRNKAEVEIELDRLGAKVVGEEHDRSRRQFEGGGHGRDTDMPGQAAPSMIRTEIESGSPGVEASMRMAKIDSTTRL